MESLVATANADFGNLAYVTTSNARGFLKQAPDHRLDLPRVPLEQQGGRRTGRAVGELNGYPAYVSNLLLSTVTKGTSGATLSQMAFGNWNDMIMGVWDDALSFLVNPVHQSSQWRNHRSRPRWRSTSTSATTRAFAIVTDVEDGLIPPRPFVYPGRQTLPIFTRAGDGSRPEDSTHEERSD
jgi:hypothetical protein